MRTVLIAAVVALLPLQALAQGMGGGMGGMGGGMGGGKHRQSRGAPTSDADKRKRMAAEEAAAKAALSKIPDSKEKYDPWRIAR